MFRTYYSPEDEMGYNTTDHARVSIGADSTMYIGHYVGLLHVGP